MTSQERSARARLEDLRGLLETFGLPSQGSVEGKQETGSIPCTDSPAFWVEG